MVAFETAEMLQKNNLKCVTAVVAGSPLAQKLIKNGFDVLEWQAGSFNAVKNIQALRRLFHADPTTTVLVQQLRDLFFIRVALFGFPEIEVIGISHTFVGISKKDWYHKWTYSRVQSLIALTEVHRNNLIERLPIAADKVVVIPNSVDTEWFSPVRKNMSFRQELGCDDETLLIGLIGRLDKAKGQSVLLKAASLFKHDIPDFKIVLVGEETLNEPGTLHDLKAQCKELGLENNVVFTGFRSDVPQIAASLDILVMSSDAETFGRVIIEGMASAVAVVASKAGGVVDIVDDGETGFMFEPGNHVELADKIFALYNNRDLRKAIAQNGRLKALNEYDQAKVNERLLSTLTNDRSLH
jgi:glycosyltransferase involved in cell wall biosynthesis